MAPRQREDPEEVRFWRAMLANPAFQKAWAEVGDTCPSVDAVQMFWKSFIQSPAYSSSLCCIVNDLVKAGGDWAISIDWATVDAAQRDTTLVADHAFDDVAFQKFQKIVSDITGAFAVRCLLGGVIIGLAMRHNLDEQPTDAAVSAVNTVP